MALTSCANCGGEISDRAPACPHCGRPQVVASNGESQLSAAVWTPAAPSAAGAGPGAARVGLSDLGVLTAALSAASDLRKLAVVVIGFFATIAAITLFSGLASLGARTAVGTTPGFRPAQDLASTIVGFLLSVVLTLVAVWIGGCLTIGTVTRMCVDQEPGSDSWRRALGYVMGHLSGFLFGPLVFWIMLWLLAIAELIVLQLAKIPFLGELLFGVATLPILVINLLLVIAWTFGWFLIFPAVAIDGANAISAGIRVLRFIRRDPVRIVLQLWTAFFLAFLVTLILSGIVVFALLISTVFAAGGLGDKFGQLLGQSVPAIPLLGPVGLAALTPPPAPFTIGIARFLVQISAGAFLSGFVALPLVFVIASATALYASGARRALAVATPEVPLAPPVLAPDAVV